ncbi:MAG: PqqD family protein [Acidobacteriota bacterium]|nr:PqqD family protein [Acidobacteriota bacterium]
MTCEIDSDSTISIAEDVIFREIHGEAVLLNLQTGKYFGLDEVGTAIWGLLAGHRTVEAVLDGLAERYEAPRERLEIDLGRFLELLRDRELISVIGR